LGTQLIGSGPGPYVRRSLFSSAPRPRPDTVACPPRDTGAAGARSRATYQAARAPPPVGAARSGFPGLSGRRPLRAAPSAKSPRATAAASLLDCGHVRLPSAARRTGRARAACSPLPAALIYAGQVVCAAEFGVRTSIGTRAAPTPAWGRAATVHGPFLGPDFPRRMCPSLLAWADAHRVINSPP
jgi:hypothetical protein